MRKALYGLLVATLAATGLFYSAGPASACSCAGYSDLRAAIDQSPAAFVGHLIDRRDPDGLGPFLDSGRDVVYVFEVEEWIKGDLGHFIEVHSAADGASCGLEFWNEDNRTGAFLSVENGQIHSSLCSQVDPDVLLAAAHPPLANPGMSPALIVGASGTTELTMLAATGDVVGVLDPLTKVTVYESTSDLSLCPGGDALVQHVGNTIVVWDLGTYEIAATYDLGPFGDRISYFDLSCRDEKASSIWLLVAEGEFPDGDRIYELVPEPSLLLEVPWGYGQLGGTHVVVTDDPQTSVFSIDYATGRVVTLVAVPQDRIVGAQGAPNPINGTTAVVVVEYHGGEGDPDTTVRLFGSDGVVVAEYPIAGEGGAATWLDEKRLALVTYDFHRGETGTLNVVNVNTGEMTKVSGWSAWTITGEGNDLYGTAGGPIRRVDLNSGEVTDLTVLPYQNIDQMVVVSGLEPPGTIDVAAPVSPQPTTPPLIRDPVEVSLSGTAARATAQTAWWVVAGGSMAAAAVYLVRRRKLSGEGHQVE